MSGYADEPILLNTVEEQRSKKKDETKCETIVEGEIWVVENLMTEAECKALIELSEQKLGYEEAPITTSYGPEMMKDVRNNWRAQCKDSAFANYLFEKLKPFIPMEHKGRDAVGLNEFFRFYRYSDGEYFKPHYDGCFARDNLERSFITVQVYLNDGFEGGETTFFSKKFKNEDNTWKCIPKTGSCLLFMHAGWLHEGSELISGTKYAVRSDVMYRAPNKKVAKMSNDE
jgi:prolyl 4-hydroxylase